MSLNDNLTFALRKVAEKLQLKSYNLNYNNLDGTIENYFGVLVPIRLIGESEDGKIHKDLIAKLPPNKKELRDAGIIEILYGAETFFYSTLMPHFKAMYRFDLSELIPECYYSDSTKCKEVIVLEDMCRKGYRRYQGDRFLDFDHVVVSLKSLAQLHALSMLFNNDLKVLDEKKSMKPYSSTFPKKLMIALKNSLKNNLYIFEGTDHKRFFSSLLHNFDDIVNNNTVEVKRMVYGHGDFWKENILYQYEDNKPLKACILDYQTTRLLSPAQDVLSFLLTSTKAKLRRRYYEHFLSTYYNCLHQNISVHGLITDFIYSRKDFNQDLHTVAPYCFITTNMSFSLWLGLEETALVKSKNLHKDYDKKDAAKLSYKKMMLDIVEDFITFEYYNI